MITMLKCPECGGLIVKDSHTLEYYCSNCGLVVVEQPLDLHFERRVLFDDYGRDLRRCGSYLTYKLHDYGIGGTKIYYQSNDKVSLTFKKKVYRLNNLLKRNKKESKLIKLLDTIQRISSQLNLPQAVCEEACYIARKFHSNENKTKYYYTELAKAAIILACKIKKIPILTGKIVAPSERRRVNDYYRRIKRMLVKKKILTSENNVPHEAITRHLECLCNQLGLLQELSFLLRAYELVKNENVNPYTAPATLIKLLCGKRKNVTFKRLSQAAGISESTIRNNCKKLWMVIKMKLPSFVESVSGYLALVEELSGVKVLGILCGADSKFLTLKDAKIVGKKAIAHVDYAFVCVDYVKCLDINIHDTSDSNVKKLLPEKIDRTPVEEVTFSTFNFSSEPIIVIQTRTGELVEGVWVDFSYEDGFVYVSNTSTRGLSQCKSFYKAVPLSNIAHINTQVKKLEKIGFEKTEKSKKSEKNVKTTPRKEAKKKVETSKKGKNKPQENTPKKRRSPVVSSRNNHEEEK